MGLIKDGLYAFRGRRFVEWLFTERPGIPLLFGVSFYSLVYLTYKYDLVSRWKGQPTYNDYSYVRQATERERARVAALSSSPTPIDPTTSSPSSLSSSTISSSLSATGVN